VPDATPFIRGERDKWGDRRSLGRVVCVLAEERQRRICAAADRCDVSRESGARNSNAPPNFPCLSDRGDRSQRRSC